MRQVGFLAAAGIYALDHHLERLEEDHRKAKKLAQGIAAIKNLAIRPEEVETNILYFDTALLSGRPRKLSPPAGPGVSSSTDSQNPDPLRHSPGRFLRADRQGSAGDFRGDERIEGNTRGKWEKGQKGKLFKFKAFKSLRAFKVFS